MKSLFQTGVQILVATIGMCGCSSYVGDQRPPDPKAGEPLTIVAIGDAGQSGGDLRGTAGYLTDMCTGRHDGGKFDVMVFLGDNFYNTGLNIPVSDVEGRIKSILGPYKTSFETLGRSNVHAIAGNHDYYARNVIETSILFGLITISEGPVGFTDRGNKREAEIQYWTYHYRMPANAFYAVAPGARDSVQLIFFDSALLLRTDPHTWRPALDSLQRLLVAARDRPGILWRVFGTHHPFYTVGEHGGYTEWNDETHSVEYLTACDKDSNAVGWIKNWLDPQDLCADKYKQYVDSVKSVIRVSGVKIQLVMSGHDHCLELLYYPEKDAGYAGWPKVHVISGAGSRTSRVKLPLPPHEFTSAQTRPEKEGMSVPGFAQLCFQGDKLRIVFFSSDNGDVIDMGGGKKEFLVDTSGALISQ
jgi:hypothetical protein